MWKDTSPVELKSGMPQIPTTKPVSEDEMSGILERLETTRDIFRENRELKSVLTRRDAETKELRARNSELEEIMRKVAPVLMNAATTMGMATKTENK